MIPTITSTITSVTQNRRVKMSPPTQEIALVTGSNVGIGFEIAKQLLQQPDNRFFVFVASRSLTKGQAAVTKLHEQGLTHCEAIQLDVTDDTSITSAVETVQQTFGVLDVLINNVCSPISHPNSQL